MEIKSDIEIAQSCEMKNIREIAATAGVDEKYLEPVLAWLADSTGSITDWMAAPRLLTISLGNCSPRL